MYPANQQQTQLPFNPSGLNTQPRQFGPNQPPANVGNLNIPQILFNFVPYAASGFANAVNAQATLHPGRTFLFNQVSDNNYNNQIFQAGVQLTLDIICLGLVRNTYQNPEQGLNDAASRAASLISANNFNQYPQLQAYVTQDVLSGAATINYSSATLMNEINEAKRRMMQPQMGSPMGMNRPTQGSGFPIGGNNMGFGGFQQPQNPGSAVGGTSIFGGGSVQAAAQTADNTNTKYDYLKTPIAEEKPQAAAIQSFQGFKAPEPEAAPLPSAVDWVPSLLQPHPLAGNPGVIGVELNQVVEKTVDGFVNRAEYAYFDIDGENMDRDAHAIGPMWTLAVSIKSNEDATTPKERADMFRRNVTEINASEFRASSVGQGGYGIRSDEESVEPVLLFEDIEPIVGYYVDEVIHEGRLHGYSEQSVSEANLFRVKAIVCKPVVTRLLNKDSVENVKKYHEWFLKNLQSARTFGAIVQAMDTVIKNKEHTSAAFIAALDKMLTFEINSILRNKLSMKTRIGSFYEDILDLGPFLQKKYGDVFMNALHAAEPMFYARCVSKNDINVVQADDEDPTNASVVLVDYIPQNYSLTYLEVHSRELDFDLVDDIGTSLNSKVSPAMYNVAAGIFKFEEYSKLDFTHHLVITLDDVVYEVHNGLIGKMFTVSKFK